MASRCGWRCCIYWRERWRPTDDLVIGGCAKLPHHQITRFTMVKRLLKGGRVVDPANGRDGIFDVLIEGDRISRVGRDLPVERDARVTEIPSGLLVCPGLIDMHVHLREPGQEHKETVAT